MPTKRKNAETVFNLEPQTLEKTEEKIPKKLKQILEFQKNRENNKKSTHNADKVRKLLTLKSGETMRDFSRRVDDNARIAINLAFKKTTITKNKRSENSKIYKRNLKNKNSELDEGLDELLEQKLKNESVVKFGEQAQAPPTFKSLPKVKAYMPAIRGKRIVLILIIKDEEINKKMLTPAQKRILENEREVAIAQYRLQKQRNVQMKLANFEKSKIFE